MYLAVGVFWTLLYLYFGLSDIGWLPERNAEHWSNALARPGMTFTLSVMIMGMMRRQAMRKKSRYYPGDPDVR